MKKMSKINSWFKSIDLTTLLKSRVLLYLLLLLSIVYLLVTIMAGNFVFCAIFFLIGFLTSFFSKNMIVIMVVSLVTTNLLKITINPKEGFEGRDKESRKKRDSDDSDDDKSVNTSKPTSTPTSTPTSKPTSKPTSNPTATTSAKSKNDDPKMTSATLDIQKNFKRLADIQLKMLENISELKPVLMQSKDTLEQIKKFAANAPATSPKSA